MPSERFVATHYSFPPLVGTPHFRGTRFEAPPSDDDPGWEPHEGGRRIRVHGPFVVATPAGELECSDGWLVEAAGGVLSVEEA